MTEDTLQMRLHTPTVEVAVMGKHYSDLYCVVCLGNTVKKGLDVFQNKVLCMPVNPSPMLGADSQNSRPVRNSVEVILVVSSLIWQD